MSATTKINAQEAINERLDKVVTQLNGWLEEDPFWEEEFQCPKDKIVDMFGFGYQEGKEGIWYLDGDNIVKVGIPLGLMEGMIKIARTQAERIQTIMMLYIHGEDENEEELASEVM